MSWFSKGIKKLTGAAKNILKGVGKVGSAIGKGFKKVWNSKIGKLIIIAAAIYFTAGMAAYASGPVGTVGTASAFAPASVGAQLSAWTGIGAVAPAATGEVTAATLAAETGTAAAGMGAGTGTAGLLGATESGLAAASTVPGIAGAAAPVAAAGAAAPVAAAAEAGMSVGQGLLYSAGLQAGATALAAANTPSAAEEEADMRRARQRANNLTPGGWSPTPYQYTPPPSSSFAPTVAPTPQPQQNPGLLQ